MTLMSSPVSSPTLPAVRYLGFKRIGADRERVFAALSDPRELTRWFAEHAQVSLEPGAPFRFWGRHTPFVPRAADADQVLWRLVPGKVLAFTWTWLKSPGAVWLELADDRAGGGCAVLVVHDLFNDQTGFGTDTPCALSDLWDVGLANLREYVERGSPALRPDFTPKDQGVEMSIIVNAPPSRVFDALTTPELMNKWLAVAAEVEPREQPPLPLELDERRADGDPALEAVQALLPGSAFACRCDKKYFQSQLEYRSQVAK